MEIVCTEPPDSSPSFSELGLKIIRTADSGAVFNDILKIRAQVYGVALKDARVDGDEYADHYCAYVHDVPLAVIRGTQAKRGKIDCEEFYPPKLMSVFRNKIASATRFCSINKKDDKKILPELTPLFTKTAWFDQLNQGMRLDIINVREEMIGYYQNFGYLVVDGSFFIHPLWKTKSMVMLLPADPSLDTPFKSIFKALSDPLTLDMIKPYLNITEV